MTMDLFKGQCINLFRHGRPLWIFIAMINFHPDDEFSFKMGNFHHKRKFSSLYSAFLSQLWIFILMNFKDNVEFSSQQWILAMMTFINKIGLLLCHSHVELRLKLMLIWVWGWSKAELRLRLRLKLKFCCSWLDLGLSWVGFELGLSWVELRLCWVGVVLSWGFVELRLNYSWNLAFIGLGLLFKNII